MIGIYSYPHGITLNPRQWLLKDDEVATFNTVGEAVSFLNKCTKETHDEDGWENFGVFFGDYDPEDE